MKTKISLFSFVLSSLAVVLCSYMTTIYLVIEAEKSGYNRGVIDGKKLPNGCLAHDGVECEMLEDE